MSASKTLREITGLGNTPTTVGKSALVLIDCQNTYREGIMQLEGVEPALVQCEKLLARYRDAGRPVIHIQHDAGTGSPYDVNNRIGAIADDFAPKLLGTTTKQANPTLLDRVRQLIATNQPSAVQAALAAMMRRDDSTALLPSITMPTLVLVGEEDQLTPPALSASMAAALPHASMVVIPRAGHLPNLEQPEAFNAALLTFLGGL